MAGQQGSEEAAGSGKEADGPLRDQAPTGAPLNFPGGGNVQKAEQPSYSAVARGAVVPTPMAVDAALDKPVGATGTAEERQGREDTMSCSTVQIRQRQSV